MKNIIFKRKDQTSIFCTQPNTHRNTFKDKSKIFTIFFAFTLIFCGIWIISVTI